MSKTGLGGEMALPNRGIVTAAAVLFTLLCGGFAMAQTPERLEPGLRDRLSGVHLDVKADDSLHAFDEIARQLKVALFAPLSGPALAGHWDGPAPDVLERIARRAEGRWGTFRGCLYFQPETTAGIRDPGRKTTLPMPSSHAFIFSLTTEQLDALATGKPVPASAFAPAQRVLLMAAVQRRTGQNGMTDAEIARKLVTVCVRAQPRVYWRGQLVQNWVSGTADPERRTDHWLFSDEDPEDLSSETEVFVDGRSTVRLHGNRFSLADADGREGLLSAVGLRARIGEAAGLSQWYVTAGRWNALVLVTLIQLCSHSRLDSSAGRPELRAADSIVQVRQELEGAEVLWRLMAPVVKRLSTSPANELGPARPLDVRDPRLLPWSALPK